TRQECARDDQWRAGVLERVDADALPGYLKNRVLMRRAGVWASLAYQLARKGEAAEAAAKRSLAELARISKSELAAGDARTYSETAMRVSASRWASVSPTARKSPSWPQIVTVPGEPGE